MDRYIKYKPLIDNHYFDIVKRISYILGEPIYMIIVGFKTSRRYDFKKYRKRSNSI